MLELFPGCKPIRNRVDAGRWYCCGVSSGVKPQLPPHAYEVPDLISAPGHCHCVAPWRSSCPGVKGGCITPIPQPQCPFPKGGVEGPKGLHTLCGGATGFAHPSWRTQGCCLQEKELFLWTCSTNQANPPCVVVRRLTGAHPWEGDEAKEEVSLLDLGRGSPCTLIYAITATCIAFFPSPFNRLLDTSLPGIWGHPTPSPAPITICSPQPCAAQPQFLVHCSSTALCAILSPWL